MGSALASALSFAQGNATISHYQFTVANYLVRIFSVGNVSNLMFDEMYGVLSFRVIHFCELAFHWCFPIEGCGSMQLMLLKLTPISRRPKAETAVRKIQNRFLYLISNAWIIITLILFVCIPHVRYCEHLTIAILRMHTHIRNLCVNEPCACESHLRATEKISGKQCKQKQRNNGSHTFKAIPSNIS